MRYGIMTQRNGWKTENGAMREYHGAGEALPDMRPGDQLIPLPRLGQSAEFMDKIRRMKH